jgi:hypothetical protein
MKKKDQKNLFKQYYPMNSYRIHSISIETIFKFLLILAFFILSFLSVAVSGYGHLKEIPANPSSMELTEDLGVADI